MFWTNVFGQFFCLIFVLLFLISFFFWLKCWRWHILGDFILGQHSFLDLCKSAFQIVPAKISSSCFVNYLCYCFYLWFYFFVIIYSFVGTVIYRLGPRCEGVIRPSSYVYLILYFILYFEETFIQTWSLMRRWELSHCFSILSLWRAVLGTVVRTV